MGSDSGTCFTFVEMTKLITLLAFLLTFQCVAQELPRPPAPDPVDLRLNFAGGRMQKASGNRLASIGVLIGGGIITSVLAIKGGDSDQKVAFGIGAATIGGFSILQVIGARHDRKAAHYLKGGI